MESFIDDMDNRLRKRKFDTSDSDTLDLHFDKTRHNLMAEFGDTPTKSLRTSYSDYRSSLNYVSPFNESSQLKKDLVTKDAEIIALKATIKNLENQVSQCEVAARHAKFKHEEEMMKLKTDLDRDQTKLTEIRSKLHQVMQREMNAQEEVKRLEEIKDKQSLEASKKLIAAQNEKYLAADQVQQLKEKLLQTEKELRSEMYKLMNDKLTLQSKVSEAEAQLTLRKGVQAENERLLKEVEDLRRQLEKEQDRNKELEKQFSEQEDNIITTKALKNDLDLVPKMKSELEKLRMDNEQLRHNEQNTLLLEEEVRSLKNKLEYANQIEDKVTRLEVENEDLQGRLLRWEATDTSGSRRPMSPSSLSRRVIELETVQARSILSQGDLQTELKISQRKLENAEEKVQTLQLALAAEKKKTAHLTDQDRRSRRKNLLIAKERDSYKSLLDSFESEVTLNFDDEKKAQLQKQEEVLLGYREQNTALEAEVRTLSENLVAVQVKFDQAKHQLESVQRSGQQKYSMESQDLIKQLQEQIAVLENSLLQTREEKDILEARIEQRNLQGDYDPSKIKVIHFTMNPFAKAQAAHQAEINKLREDNDTLRKRNEILEKHGKVEDITIQVKEKLKQPSPSKEVEEVKEQLKRQETRNQRLMEVFKKKSQEFREVCYQLTGYQIDFPCTNQYRLTNMYAESPHDYLLFQRNERGEMLMLQTDFSMTLQEAMAMYLQDQNSIPMFLSHITMDLFSKQTMNFG